MNLTEMTFDYKGRNVRVVGAFTPFNDDEGAIGVVDEAEPIQSAEPFYAKASDLIRDGIALPEMPFVHDCGSGTDCRFNGRDVKIVGAQSPLNMGPEVADSMLDDGPFAGHAAHYILKG